MRILRLSGVGVILSLGWAAFNVSNVDALCLLDSALRGLKRMAYHASLPGRFPTATPSIPSGASASLAYGTSCTSHGLMCKSQCLHSKTRTTTQTKSGGSRRMHLYPLLSPADPFVGIHRLVTLYQTVYDAIHAKSGQDRTLKLQYLRTSQESVMGWVSAFAGKCNGPRFYRPSSRSLSRSNYILRFHPVCPRVPP